MKEYISERGTMGVVTNLQLAFNGLERAEKGQRGIQGFFNAGQAGPSSARGSPAPATAPSAPSSKALGKRKADTKVVDLTLDDEDEDEIEFVRTPDDELPPSKTNGHERSRSAGSAISLDDDDSDLEIIQVAPAGPVYQCPRCAAIVPLVIDEKHDLAAARKKAEKSHKEWHERYAATNGQSKKVAKDKPPKKKKKGQQKLKSFFKKS
jgi:hypothetical protein